MRLDGKGIGGLTVAAAATAPAIAVVMLRPSAPAAQDPAREAAKEEVEAMYHEARAVAEADAKARAELREAELQAAEEIVNPIEADPEPSSVSATDQ